MSSQNELELQRWERFGAWLRELRGGRTRPEVAAASSVGLPTLAYLERGGFRRNADEPKQVPNPRDETLIRIAEALGVDPGEMFKRVGHYDDRPATTGSRRREDRREPRLAEMERRLADLRAEMDERLAALERRVSGYGEAPRQAPKRRSAPG
jgi:transcriptional regulator with XRE-family HTH domain